MGILKEFEIDILQRLAIQKLSSLLIEQLSDEGELVELYFTGVGYFLTLRHSSLPEDRVVLDRPIISGTAGELQTGFIAFVENGEVTLECYSFGNDAVPGNFRDLDVRVNE
ncbi:hypothetical protein [Thalassovita sp.]|jgi:hypothetical protein|uniref:hypothetical protein n=1 Tax=Thalassovita sp. TaxID=1979401 RepID=UPI003B5B890E